MLGTTVAQERSERGSGGELVTWALLCRKICHMHMHIQEHLSHVCACHRKICHIHVHMQEMMCGQGKFVY